MQFYVAFLFQAFFTNAALGLSYGATSLALEALGVYLCKSRIYDAVQEAAKLVPGLKRDQVFAGVETPALGGDLTSVKCKGEWIPFRHQPLIPSVGWR